MITVTPGARDRLILKLGNRKAAADEALRFTRRQGGWSLKLDSSRPADTEITHKGRKVLLLDKAVSDAMSDKTLDIMTTDDGPRLTLR